MNRVTLSLSHMAESVLQEGVNNEQRTTTSPGTSRHWGFPRGLNSSETSKLGSQEMQETPGLVPLLQDSWEEEW